MLLSICLDRLEDEAQPAFRARAGAIEALAPDLVLLAREDEAGAPAPPRVEALVDIGWITGTLRTPAVITGLPALHAVPFHVARALSAADFLSGGRAGWMPLRANAAAFDAGYGTAHADDDAAERADDFVRATRALWDSWDDDAPIIDQSAGRYLDSAKVRRVDYRGSHFATMGSLNAARPPQGHPLLVRDVDDLPDAREPADVVIGVRPPAARPGTIRLLRITGDPHAAAARIAAGEAEGLHLAGPDGLAMLRSVRGALPAAVRSGTARDALGLPRPVNPFADRKAA